MDIIWSLLVVKKNYYRCTSKDLDQRLSHCYIFDTINSCYMLMTSFKLEIRNLN